MEETENFEHVINVASETLIQEGNKVLHDPRIASLLIPEKALRRRIRKLARQICRDYRQSSTLRAVILLKGAFVFAADLGREICRCGGPELRYDFLKPVTYGTGIKTNQEASREVKIDFLLEELNDEPILVIDDILDQAFTLSAVRQYLQNQHGVSSLRFCVLLEKMLEAPSGEVRSLRENLQPEYVGFRIPDRWVAGYGIDAGEDFRYLPYIVTVKEEYYR